MKDIDSLMNEYAEEAKGNKENDLKRFNRNHFDKKISLLQRKRLILSIALILILSLIVVIAILPFTSSEGEVPVVPGQETPPIANPSLNLGQKDDDIIEVPSTGDLSDIFYGEVSVEEYYDYAQYLTLPYIDEDDYDNGLFSLIIDEDGQVSGYSMFYGCKDFCGLWDVAVIKLQGKLAASEADCPYILYHDKIINLNGIDYYYYLDDFATSRINRYIFVYMDGDALYQVYVRSFADFAPEELLNIMYGDDSPYKRT